MAKKKNAAAQELAKKRWKGTTKASRSAEMGERARQAAASMTPEQRVARAKKAVAAREAKRAAKKKQADS